MRRESPTLGKIFADGLPKYPRFAFLPAYMQKAAYAIADCRTAALGGHVKRCPHGHVERAWYNSCFHRACPQCTWGKIDRWLDRWRPKLLPTDHFHVTFTLPAELRVFWQFNKKLIGDLIFKIARRTLFCVLNDPKHLGAKPGILMALHTWSRAVLTHLHVHCLVTGGGLAADGLWKRPVREGYLAPDDRLGFHFREKFCRALERLIKAGKVELPLDMARIDAYNRINTALGKDWVVDVEERYEHGRGVAAYLARYVKGGPIKNQRLLRADDQEVRLRTSRKGEPFRAITVKVGELIRRVLEHVPPVGYRMVRACGLYHHHYREQLEACRRQLGGGTVPDDALEEAGVDAEAAEELARELALDDQFCPVCGALLDVEAIPRAPPRQELARYGGSCS